MLRLLFVAILMFYVSSALAAHPGIPGQDAPGGEVVKVPSNGVELHNVLYLPDTDKASLPALILVHGFKSYSARAGEWDTYWAKKIAATHGYVVLGVTMRGWPDTGGVDDCGLQQPEDIARVIRWLAHHPRVDPNRIGLIGGSQGGQVVLLAAAIEKSVRAVVAQFPVTDVELWSKNSNLREGVLKYIATTCAEPGSQRVRSPRFVADKIEASILLMHGDSDRQVQYEQSLVMKQALEDSRKDVELFTAVGGGHGNMKGPGWEDGERALFDFLTRKL